MNSRTREIDQPLAGALIELGPDSGLGTHVVGAVIGLALVAFGAALVWRKRFRRAVAVAQWTLLRSYLSPERRADLERRSNRSLTLAGGWFLVVGVALAVISLSTIR